MAAYMSARIVDGCSSSGEEEEDSATDFGFKDEELMATCTPSQCLFCESFYETGELVLKHIEAEHGVSFTALFCDGSFEFYSYIKLVNYLRMHKPAAQHLQSLLELKKLADLDESYLIPADSEDGLLQFDFDTYQEKLQRVAPAQSASSSDVLVVTQTAEIKRLRKELEDLKVRYSTDIAELRLSAKRFIASAPTTSAHGDSSPLQSTPNHRNVSQVYSLTEAEDDPYIGAYGHFSIHQEMLQDAVRTGSYRDAISLNADMFKDKVVLDVGCGTGILSMFAARAGAAKVIGVDMSDIVYQAMDIVRENGLADKVTVIKGRVEEIELPVNTVDIIISEWMGYFLLFESMLDSVIFARRKWMKAGGIVWPNVCSILVTASCDPSLRTNNITYWDDVYGFKMSCMKREVCRDGLVQVVSPEHLICQPCCVKTVDCNTCDVADLDFSADFTLCVERDGSVQALVGYFDTVFDCETASTKVAFSTGALTKPTHWKQTVFLLSKPLEKLKDECITGSIDVRKLANDPRSLQVEMTLEKTKYKYILA